MPEIKKYLNRDGLDEYNSLLPHSSAEMQTYVNEWMDEHPEASTTVQDGAITERKLAAKSVSLRTLADDTVHMLKGAILTENLSGEVLTADDAYSAPPVALTVEGKSTQDGTPTPAAPVEIVSLEQVNLGFYGRNLLDPTSLYNGYITSSGGAFGSTNRYKHSDYLPVSPNVTYRVSQEGTDFADSIYTAFYDENKSFLTSRNQRGLTAPTFTAPANAAYMRSSFYGPDASKAMIEIDRGTYEGFAPYSVQSVLLNLTQPIRSLPDGTKDTLALSYLRPSTREGWAWYSRELVQKLHEITLNACTWLLYSATAFYTRGLNLPFTAGNVEVLCNIFKPSASKNLGGLANAEINSIQVLGRNELGIKTASEYQDESAFVASLDDSDVAVAKLAAPITTQLDPVELPVLPAPTCTVWADPTTGLQMEYVRDSNLVIQRIEQAIADQ